VRLKLLLDEHISESVADALRRRFPALDVQSIYQTSLKGLADPPLLEVLDQEKRTLVTRDVNSVPLHVRRRLAENKTHAGVIYIDSRRLFQKDVRGLIHRLKKVVEKHGDEDWTCREGWA
jgi:hypothetical protein